MCWEMRRSWHIGGVFGMFNSILLSLGLWLPLMMAEAPDIAMTTDDGRRLSVAIVEDYLWPESVEVRSPSGEVNMIDVFPLVTALVVSAADGSALGQGDEGASRAAAESFCVLGGGRFDTEGKSRLNEGRWAFQSCTKG